MKQETLTFAVLCAGCALTLAGPEPMPVSKEIVPPPVEQTCFQGWYFGVQGGGVLANFNQNGFADESSLGARGNGFVAAEADSTHSDQGTWLGGLHLGYNWVRGHWVFGAEADISATGLDQRQTTTASVFLPNNTDVPFTTSIDARSTVDWFSTVRPRFGYLFGNRVLLFVTGGLAFGQTDLRGYTNINAYRNEYPSYDRESAYSEDRAIRVGWTGGAGFEFCVSEHVSLSFTYLYTDLGDSHIGSDIAFVGNPPPRTFDTHTRASSENNFHAFEGGVSFHF